MAGRPDIALVSLRTTMGWQRADDAFAEQVRAAGATCEVRPIRIGPSAQLRRTMALTDLVEALAARKAARGVDAGAVVYSSVTAALLQQRRAPTAIRFDGIAALNRQGLGGAWQRRREREILGRATLLLPWSRAAAEAAAAAQDGSPATIILPPPVAEPPPAPDRRDRPGPDAISYAGNPGKRGLDLVCEAWRSASHPGARLAIGGVERDAGMRWLAKAGSPEPDGVEWLGKVARDDWLALVASAGLYVNGSRFEEWGLAQMETLGAGTPLVTVPTPGPNVALPLARRLAPQLVADDCTAGALASALRRGFGLDAAARERYAAEAVDLLAPYREEPLRRRVADEVLPLLLGSRSS